MQIQYINDTLCIHAVSELSAATARSFREEFCAALKPELNTIEIDLAETSVVDSGGLAALVSLHRLANERHPAGSVRMRLLHPQPQVLQLLELTRLHHVFEIVASPSRPESSPVAVPAPAPAPAAAPQPKLQST